MIAPLPFARAAAWFAVVWFAALCGWGCGGKALPNFGVVEEGMLYRGGQPTDLGLAELRDEHGIRLVANFSRRTADSEMTPTVALGMSYLPVPTGVYRIDNRQLVRFLAALRRAEAEGTGPVYVHCTFGQDRTGFVVAVYRVVEQGWPAERALGEMSRYRDALHKLLFPHLAGYVRDVARHRQQWLEAVERVDDPGVIRPPAPWWRDPPATRPAAGAGMMPLQGEPWPSRTRSTSSRSSTPRKSPTPSTRRSGRSARATTSRAPSPPSSTTRRRTRSR